MIHPKLRCPVHNFKLVTVLTDSSEMYQFKCPLVNCPCGITLSGALVASGEEVLEDNAQAQL